MMATAILGSWAVGNLLFGWLLGETRARLSLEERALGLHDPPRELSLRLRLTSVSLCIARSKLGSTRTSTSPKTNSRSPSIRTRTSDLSRTT